MSGLNNLFKMILAMVLTIVTISCEKDNGGSGIDSTINISGKKLLTVSSEASGFEVKYSVTGSGAGQAVTAVSDQDCRELFRFRSAPIFPQRTGLP